MSGTSVIVTVKNGLSYLAETVTSIRDYMNASCEIIVVNRHDGYGVDDYCRHQKLTFVTFPPETRDAEACWIGMRLSSRDYLMYMDDTVTLLPKTHRNLINCLNSGSRIGCVSPVVTEREHAACNEPDPGLWREIEVLQTPCFVLHRRVFERIDAMWTGANAAWLDIFHIWSSALRAAGYMVMEACDTKVLMRKANPWIAASGGSELWR